MYIIKLFYSKRYNTNFNLNPSRANTVFIKILTCEYATTHGHS